MANAFAPDIGMDIGASNVTPQSAPRSIDFSGLARSLSGAFEPKKVSETEAKANTLRPVMDSFAKAGEIEDPVRKDITFRQLYKSALTAYPEYRTDLEGLYGQVRGIELPTGSPLTMQETMVTEFGKTAEGATSSVIAYSSARRPDGTIDEDLYNAKMAEDAFAYQTMLAKSDRVKREVDLGNLTAEQGWETSILPDSINVANTQLDKITSAPVVSNVLNGMGDAVQVQQLVDYLKIERTKLEAEVNQKKALIGANDAKYDNKAIFSKWDALITTIETNSTTLQNAMANQTKQDQAKFMAGLTDPRARLLMTDQNARSQQFITLYGDDANVKNDINNAMKLVPIFQNPYNSIPTGPGTQSDPATLDDVSLADRQKILSEFNPEAVKAVSLASVVEKKSYITGGLAAIKAFDPDSIKTSEHAVAAAEPLAITFLTLTERPQSEVSESKYIQDVFSDKTLTLIQRIEKSSPETGKNLYMQAQKYAKSETSRLVDSLNANLSLLTPPGKNPFFVTIENDQVVLKLDDNAVTQDLIIRQLLNPTTARNPRQPSPIDVKSMRPDLIPYAVLDKFSGITDRTSGRTTQIKDNIKALNLLYTQLNKLPDELKDGPMSGRVYLAMGLNTLPGYVSSKPPSALPVTPAPVEAVTQGETK